MVIFAVSDVHGFYNEMIEALDKAGFDRNNPNHLLVSCGDNFDRGPDAVKVYEYLNNMENCVLVRGNHELLMRDCLMRGSSNLHDITNGTTDTIVQFGDKFFKGDPERYFSKACEAVLPIFNKFDSKMVNYFETAHYVFVHGYLPKGKHWREADSSMWEKASWYNGMEKAMGGQVYNKCVVAGHFHASWGHARKEHTSEFGEDANFTPFYYKDKLIAIDSCVAMSKFINVVVLEDEV